MNLGTHRERAISPLWRRRRAVLSGDRRRVIADLADRRA